MDIQHKIDLLGEAAQYDVCRGCGTHTSRQHDDVGRWIYPAVRPDGKRVALLKVLQSNVCERDCAYCANRCQRDIRRSAFTPDELARTFAELVQRGRAQGLFLSSGVCGSVGHATERMLATVELVRRHYHFGGYIHLKILPGADDASIEASVRLADRVSVNLEAPNGQRLRALSSTKDFEHELLASLRRAHRIRRELGCATSMTTQYVVGAAGESDRELLTTSTRLYGEIGLTRAYYSAFQPVPQTPLEGETPTPTWREHRLYQADFLLRQYGFELQELIFDGDDHLPRDVDPKLVWALHHPEYFPLEVNRASREELLRIPGVGPRTAGRILQQRRQGKLRELRDIRHAGASAGRMAPFVLFDGRRPSYQAALPQF